MHWQLLWPAVGGVLVGLLGALAVPGRHPLAWPLSLLFGLGGSLGGNVLAVAVLGPDHRTVSLVVAVVLAAIVVSGLLAFLRTREFA